jgi:hypothetical protein
MATKRKSKTTERGTKLGKRLIAAAEEGKVLSPNRSSR